GIESFDAAVRTSLLPRSDYEARKRPRPLVVGAGSATSGAVPRTVGADHAADHPAQESQRGRGGLCQEAGGAAVARADFGGTFSVCAAENPGSKVLAAARACDGSAAPWWSG